MVTLKNTIPDSWWTLKCCSKPGKAKKKIETKKFKKKISCNLSLFSIENNPLQIRFCHLLSAFSAYLQLAWLICFSFFFGFSVPSQYPKPKLSAVTKTGLHVLHNIQIFSSWLSVWSPPSPFLSWELCTHRPSACCNSLRICCRE